MNAAQQARLNEIVSDYEREIGEFTSSVHGEIISANKIKKMEKIMADHYTANPGKTHLRKYLKDTLCNDLDI